LSPPCCFQASKAHNSCTSSGSAGALEVFRTLNIDAISNWKFGSLKIDGLHRVLLYQSQHATGWAVSLSALIVLMQARDKGRVGVNMFAGLPAGSEPAGELVHRAAGGLRGGFVSGLQSRS